MTNWPELTWYVVTQFNNAKELTYYKVAWQELPGISGWLGKRLKAANVITVIYVHASLG